MSQKQSYPEAEQMAMVSQSPYNIRFIKAPCLKAQFTAVSSCWQVYKLIDQLHPKVKLIIP